jgi:hypothetical protein
MEMIPEQTPIGNRADAAGDHHRQRLADGAACQAAALDYLKRGWAPLALCPPDHAGVGKAHAGSCNSPGKAPWGPWKEYQDRLPTEDELRRKWADNATLNVGAALGPVSNLVRVDVDGAAAQATLLELSRGRPLPHTLAFRSGRADGTGRGYLLAVPPGVILKTTPKALAVGEVRFQARGAQTVLPPSRHKDGGLYEWLSGCGAGEIEPAPMPGWMVDIMRAPPSGIGAPVARKSRSEWDLLLGGVGPGSRHGAILSIVGKVLVCLSDAALKDDLTLHIHLELVLAYNQRHEPPKPEDEVRRVFADLVAAERRRRGVRATGCGCQRTVTSFTMTAEV